MSMVPVAFRWMQVDIVDHDDGVVRTKMAMVPHVRYEKVAARQFRPDDEYPMVVVEARSRASHNHYFAAINDGFNNLPETIAARWPTAEHLRKYALIECSYFTEKEFEMDTLTRARQLGTFIRADDDYSRIFIRGTKVIIRKAKSQDHQTMDKAEFEASKKAVLSWIEETIGLERGKLRKEAGRNG